MNKSQFKINNIFRAAGLALLLAGATSCTRDFDDVNTNPYALTDELAQRDGFREGAYFITLENEVIPIQENRYQFGESMIGHPLGRYLPPTNSWQGTNFQTFNPSAAWTNMPFNNAFGNVYPSYFNIQRLTNETGVNYAWAKIIRVAAMQRLTDMYGPIPYSKVRDGQLSAGYDDQQTAYKTMIKDLTDAVAELQKYISSSGNAKPMKNYDRVYGGDFSKWVKFANSLKLRMAMRMVYADATAARQAAEEAVAAGVMDVNDDNAAIETNLKNPIFIVSGWGESRASAELISYLKGYNDSRIGKFLNQATFNSVADYYGVRACMTMDKNTHSLASAPNVTASDKLLWMPSAEVAFLKAEGAIRGWNMGSTASQLYTKGVKLSFEQWGAAGADTYLTDSLSLPANYTSPFGTNSASAVSTIKIKWKDTDPFETQLERIITQKWIAMYPLGTEAWSEFRRTGYPKFFPVVNNMSSDGVSSALGARRLVFPNSEYLNNAPNVQAAVGMLGGGDSQATKLWWDKKP